MITVYEPKEETSVEEFINNFSHDEEMNEYTIRNT